jgi:RNA polymerase sigma-70 factor (ECF subfamily)
VRTVLEAMPDTLRIPLILRDLDEMSYQEIADTLEISLSAAKMRIKRGREMFRREYEDRLREMRLREEEATVE